MEIIELTSYAKYLKPRPRHWHKGMSGHVLIVGGAPGFSGAPRMAALAALRVGAGLVTVATSKEHAAFLNIDRPEIMCHGVTTSEELMALFPRADVIVVGPGLGQSEWAHRLSAAVSQSELPLIIDADGLNILAKEKKCQDNWILTPHPGEAARLLNEKIDIIQADRLQAIRNIQKKYGGVTVLKGAGTLVLGQEGLVGLCNKGNPGMASAGMGDILSGVIAGLVGQHVPLTDAAKLGVCLHAMAGDLAARAGERGTIATDLLPHLRTLSNFENKENS